MILLYHRIKSLPFDPQKLCVTPEHFDAHLEILNRYFAPISLQQLCNNLRKGQVTSHNIVITFDDGYVDNLTIAKPILERYRIPATIFIVSDWVNSQYEFYWDDLTRILLTTPKLPNHLRIKIGEQLREWDLSDPRETQLETNYVSHIVQWDVEMKTDPSPRNLAYREIAELLHGVDSKTREQVLLELSNWAGIPKLGREDYRTLTANELHMLENGGLLEIGSHTKSHVQLSRITIAEQQEEIFDSKEGLEKLLGHKVQSFSYPFGGRRDYNRTSMKTVREAQFLCACSNFPGFIHFGTDRFQLPRFLIRDWDGIEFKERLMRWWSEE